MRRFALATLVATAVALARAQSAPQTAPPADRPQFHGGVNTVSIYATVSDETGRLVPDLSRDDFTILDDGKAQTISQFANTLQPITVVIMIDRSVSMESRFTLERAAAEAFVANLTPGDRARVGSFNGMIRIDPDGFTSDRDALIRILYLDLPDAGLTPLWNATASAMNALAPESGRRVVLLITDGDNNPGLPGRKTVSFLDVRDRAEKNDVMIYAVGVSGGCGQPSADPASSWTPSDGTGAVRAQRGMPPPPGGGPDNGGKPPSTTPRPFGGPMGPAGAGGRPVGTAAQPGPGVPIEGFFGNGMGESRCGSRTPNPELRSLAADGGGGYLELHDGDDLGTTFARLADELHHQYLLGFTITKLDGRVHALEVRARDPKMRVRSRNSYVAVAK